MINLLNGQVTLKNESLVVNTFDFEGITIKNTKESSWQAYINFIGEDLYFRTDLKWDKFEYKSKWENLSELIDALRVAKKPICSFCGELWYKDDPCSVFLHLGHPSRMFFASNEEIESIKKNYKKLEEKQLALLKLVRIHKDNIQTLIRKNT